MGRFVKRRWGFRLFYPVAQSFALCGPRTAALVLMGAKRSGCIKMGQRPHEKKSHTAVVSIKKKNRRKKVKVKAAAQEPANVTMGDGNDDMFGMGLAAPTRPTNPATSTAADKNDPQRPAEAVEQPPAFADTGKNDLFHRVFSFNGTKPGSLHPRDARRAHEELLKRQKALRKQQKDERFLTKERKPFHTPVLPY